MARSGPGSDGSDRLTRRRESRNANTTAFPLGNSPTLTGKCAPRTSESAPNHEATRAALFRVIPSGESAKTRGRLQDRNPAGSKKGRGSKERSLASGNLIPLKITVLCGSRVTPGMGFETHEEPGWTSGPTRRVMTVIQKLAGKPATEFSIARIGRKNSARTERG
jgi:hypothetical protein